MYGWDVSVRAGARRKAKLTMRGLPQLKAQLPWWTKIVAKVVLSRLPIHHSLWQRLDIFRHGLMDQPGYAFEVFTQHYDRVSFLRKHEGFVGLELGPGESLFSAIISQAFGASASYLVDVGAFARRDLQPYRIMAQYLRDHDLPVPNVDTATTLDQLLHMCGSQYLTAGLTSLRGLPDQSVDFIWSQAVLEHLRQSEFTPIMMELRRILRADGVCSHRVDLKDHLAGGLHNLRFSHRLWESNFMANSGFYTNRLRYSEMVQRFCEAGFEVQHVHVDRWDHVPTPREKLAAPFRHLPDDELCISGFTIILRPR
jgi:SAM-dependent methyltransferase